MNVASSLLFHVQETRMASPYQLAFGYLYPRPLIALSCYLGWLHPKKENKLIEPNTAANTPTATRTQPRKRTAKKTFAHIRSRISPEETEKYFERKRQREELRIRQQREREELEMAECTFHPKITEYRIKSN